MFGVLSLFIERVHPRQSCRASLTTKLNGVRAIHLIHLDRIKGSVDHGATLRCMGALDTVWVLKQRWPSNSNERFICGKT